MIADEPGSASSGNNRAGRRSPRRRLGFGGAHAASGPIALFSRVMVTSDRFAPEGAPAGSVGSVIEDYGDGAYEIEVFDTDTGVTIALFAARAEELEAV